MAFYNFNFIRSSYESCVYFRRCDEDSVTYLLFYIDDMVIAVNDKEEANEVKTWLSEEFEIKDLGTIKIFFVWRY